MTCVTADLHKCAESYPAAATRAGPGTHRMERCGVEHWGARSGAQCPMPVNVPTYVRACTACFPGCLQQARGVAAEPSSSAASSSPASSKGGGGTFASERRRRGPRVSGPGQAWCTLRIPRRGGDLEHSARSNTSCAGREGRTTGAASGLRPAALCAMLLQQCGKL